jgi:predicted dehydrogenase
MIRVAVLGAGHWGPNLIRNFASNERSRVAWVVDRDAGRLAEVRTRVPDARTGDDPAPALADPEVDAVVVATPTTTHYALARAALEQGKHVLVEKPIATDAHQGAELCSLAAARGRVLMVGHVFLFNAAIQRVKQFLERGELGRVYYVAMVRTNLGPIRVDVNAAWDLAAHDVSIVNHWLGGEPESAAAVGGTWINPGIADAVFATLRYPGGVLVNLHVSWLNPRKARTITVVGEERMLTFDDMDLNEPLRLYDKQVTARRTTADYVDSFASFRASVREGDILIPRVAGGEPLRAECEHFLDCVATGARPLTGGPEGVAVVRVLEAIERSLAAGGREERVAAP